MTGRSRQSRCQTARDAAWRVRVWAFVAVAVAALATAAGAADRAPASAWACGDGIMAGQIDGAADGYELAPGETLHLSTAEAQDTDYRSLEGRSEEVPDAVVYAWYADGGTLRTHATSPREADWTAPALGADEDSREYTVTLTVDDGGTMAAGDSGTRDDAAVARTVRVKVVATPAAVGLSFVEAKCHDWIVPGAAHNAITLSAMPATDAMPAIIIGVRTAAGSTCRQLSIPPGWRGETMVFWDGLDTAGQPLTEQDGPFSLHAAVVIRGREVSADLASRRLHGVPLSVAIGDGAEGDTGWQSGMDAATIADARGNPVGMQVGVWVGDEALETPAFVPVARFDVKVDGGARGYAYAALSRADKSRLLFYTTPTPAPGLPTLRHTWHIEQTGAGVLDNVGNPWDMNGATRGRETKMEWRMRLDAQGDVAELVRSYPK